MLILIKGGRVITSADDYYADVLIEDEKVSVIGKDLDNKVDRVIDAKGKLIIPGGIDPHTHLDMPFGGTFSADDFKTGSEAAAHGGTTSLIDFAIQKQGDSTLKGLEAWQQKAEGKCVIDYGFHMIVSDMSGERIGELDRLVDEGVTSYKLFMAYPGVLYADDGTLYRAFRRAGENNTRVSMHAENGIVIDELIREAVEDGNFSPAWHGKTRLPSLEAEAINRAIALAEVADVPLYIVHLSSSEGLEAVKRGRARGIDVTAETCPQYLFLDDSYYDRPNFEGAKWVMSPPLRHRSNLEKLWTGLRLGHIATTGTDHCPFNFKGQKEMGREDFRKIPNGAPGVENRMSLMYHGGVVEGRLSLNQWVDITSTATAKLFGMFPKKGTIAVGSDADIVIFNPDRKEVVSVDNAFTHHMNCDYSAFEGFELQGWSEIVLSRGRIIVENGSLLKEGGGEYIKRVTTKDVLR